MKTKAITNIKGKENHFGWYISTVINRDGHVRQKSKINIADFNGPHWVTVISGLVVQD